MKINSDAFRKLQAEWNSKLKKDGFVDAEDSQRNLKEFASRRYFRARNNGASFEKPIFDQATKEEYYRLATHFLNDNKFRSQLLRFIWWNHSEGVSIREISKKLKAVGIDLSSTRIGVRLLDLKKEMIKKLREQNNE